MASPKASNGCSARAAPWRDRAGMADADFPSQTYRTMLDWVRRVAPTELPVLVLGESGSGKEGVSRAVHRLSRRSAGPFLALNCAALAETLLEGELFGAGRGGCTGADRDRPGLFVQADGGTLFLDEVADMPGSMQAKLLRVLDLGRLRPVGADDERSVDVRIVAASHRDLAGEVARGAFRADLYYRLAVLRVEVPPLRRRYEDLPSLVAQLAPRLACETGHGPPQLTPDAWRRLREYAWPGNVRELHTVLARALLRTEGEEIRAAELEPLCGLVPAAPPAAPDDAPLERRMIEAALSATEGSLAAAARRIGWTRQKLYRRMAALRLSRSEAGMRSSHSSTFQ